MEIFERAVKDDQFTLAVSGMSNEIMISTPEYMICFTEEELEEFLKCISKGLFNYSQLFLKECAKNKKD